MPSPNDQPSVPPGGLGQAAAPQQPAFTSSPYGFNANPGLLAASMDPEKLMQMMKINPVSDEEIRRTKFWAGMGQPTNGGGFAVNLADASNAWADTAQEQKKLAMQYAPLMMQHMIGMQQTMQKSQELNTKNVELWENGLNARMSGLLRSGAPVTPDVIHGAIQMAGDELGVPAGYLQIYENGLASGAQPGQDLTPRIQSRIISGLTPEKAAGTLAPPVKEMDLGGVKKAVAESGQPGFTPPANMPPVTLVKGAEPQKIENLGTDKFGGNIIGYKGLRAVEGTDEAKKIQALFDADQAKVAAQQTMGPPGAPPPAAAPSPRPPIPQAPPPGVRLPQGVSLPPAQPAAQGPAQPAQASATGAAPKGGPQAVAPGVTVTPGLPDDTISQGDMSKKVGSLPIGATVKFTDIPQRPPLMNPQTGQVNPVDEAVQKDSATQFAKDTDANSKLVSSSQDVLRRMNVIEQIAKQAPLGATAEARESVAGIVRDIARITPGISEATANSWGDSIAGGGPGALAALQAFEKLAISGAMTQLRADIGSSAGQRIAMQEFLLYQNAVPNMNMTPQTIAMLHEIALRDYMRNRTEQSARTAFSSTPNANYSAFGQYWADKQDKLGLVPTNVNVGGGAGSGIDYSKITYGTASNGQPKVSNDGGKTWRAVNENFLTGRRGDK